MAAFLESLVWGCDQGRYEGMAEETVMGAKEILAGHLGESPGGRRVSSSRSGAQAGLGGRFWGNQGEFQNLFVALWEL